MGKRAASETPAAPHTLPPPRKKKTDAAACQTLEEDPFVALKEHVELGPEVCFEESQGDGDSHKLTAHAQEADESSASMAKEWDDMIERQWNESLNSTVRTATGTSEP